MGSPVHDCLLDAIDPALRRLGCFEVEIEIDVPIAAKRLKIPEKKIQQVVEWPVKHAQAFARLGIEPLQGVLLHGPPGCSKITLAKVATHASLASFFSLRSPNLRSTTMRSLVSFEWARLLRSPELSLRASSEEARHRAKGHTGRAYDNS
ncbi:hypothetical protein KSP39_PZI005845 [Platanthera zijinensis]|uniref:ATPase AAA-type core domain-containing protein n=1 Tax=Platanthera zijinensis TaxID=2320716 RepID=A0AAP0BSX9_9ASPA